MELDIAMTTSVVVSLVLAIVGYSAVELSRMSVPEPDEG